MKQIYLTIIIAILSMLPAISTAQDVDVCGMDFFEEEETFSKISSTCNPYTSVCWGRYKPAQDTLRVLMVYVRFEDDNQSMSYWNTWPNPNNVWEAESWMKNSVDSLATTMSNNYLNLTNYFRTMSNSQFIVLGDVVYVEAPSKDTFSPLTNLNLMEAVNTWVLEYLDPRIDLSKYDNYDYLGIKNHEKKPDNILDMIYMLYRSPVVKHFAGTSGGNFGGIAQLGNSSPDTLNSGLIVNYGFSGNGSGTTIHMETDRKKDLTIAISMN